MSIKKEYPRLQERKGNFYIYDYVEGKLCRQSIKTNSELEAIKILNKYIKNKEQKATSNTNEVVLFDEVALMFIQDKIRKCSENTIKQYRSIIKSALPFFSNKNMQEIKKIDLKNYEDYRRINGLNDGFLIKELKLLKSIFNYGLELELITNNPFLNYSFTRNLKKYEVRERFFTPLECQKLIQAIQNSKNDELEIGVILILETGIRIGELTNILFTDIAFQGNIPILRIRKEITKSKRERFIPLSRLAMEQINKQKLKFPTSAFIFTTSKGEPFKTMPKRAFNTALNKADLKDGYVSFHTLRHTAGSLWLQGVNIDGTQRPPVRIEIVSEVLGHKNISFTKNVYAKLDKSSVVVGFIPNEILEIKQD